MFGKFDSFLKYSGVGKIIERLGKPPKTAEFEYPSEMSRVEQTSATMLDIKASFIQSVLMEAETGEPQGQASIAASLMDNRDGVISAHWRTRRNAVTGKDWDVVAMEDGDKDKAMEMRKALDAVGISQLIGHLADKAYYGYCGAVIEWDAAGYPVRFIPVHPTNISFDLAGSPAASFSADGVYTPLVDLPEGRMVMAMEHGASTPAKAGLCRSLLWLWLLKRDAWLHRAEYLERFGSPTMKAKVTESQWADKTLVSGMISRLKSSGRRGVAIHPEGSDLEIVEAAANGSNADFHQFIADLDDIITLNILGQLATSGEAGGLSKGQAQENVRLDILASDCLTVMDAIKRQILSPMARFMYGEKFADAFEFKILYEPPDDLSNKAATVKTLFDAGLEVDQEWATETFGMPLTRKQSAPPPQTGPPEPTPEDNSKDEEGARITMTDSPMPTTAIAEEEFISRVTEATLAKLFTSKSAVSEFYMPLRREVKAVFSDLDPEDPKLVQSFTDRADALFKRYPAIYEAMGAESDGYQRIFKDAIMTAVAGRIKK